MKVFALVIASLQFKFLCGLADANLSIAFENVTRHLFQLETRMFIDNFGVDSNTLTSLILKGLNEKAMPFHFSNKELGSKILMDSSAFVTFNSFKKLRTFNDKLALTNKYYKPLQLFLFCQKANFKMIESLTVDVARKHKNKKREVRRDTVGIRENTYFVNENTALTDVINFEYFLVQEREFIRLLTFVWYSPTICGKLQLMEINRFSLKTLKWGNDIFSLEKVANFHGCVLNVFNAYPTFSTFYYISIPYDLSNVLNYKLKLTEDGQKARIDFYLHMACYDAQDNMKYFDNLLDSTTGEKNKTKVEYFMAWPVAYLTTWLTVPPSQNYTEYEKLAMPFDSYTWALITFVFVVSFSTILIFYCVRRSTRDLVIGSNVTTPSLNIVRIFFGIGLIVLPRRNFARFLTISFILYCLIIRTTWQGKMFEFMTKTIPKPEIQTVEEMLDGGYDFYLEPDFKQKYPESAISKRGRIKSNNESFQMKNGYNYKLMFNPNFKGVLALDYFHVSAYVKASQGRFIKRIRKDLLSTKTCGLAFMSHHHFTGIFDLKSQQKFAAGITHYLFGINLDYETIAKHDMMIYKLPPEPPKILTIKQLEPGFVIFSSCLLISLVVFVLELLLSTLLKHVLLSFQYRNEFGVANLGLNAANVAIAVVPEIENIEPVNIENIGDQEHVVINWTDEATQSYDDAELSIKVEEDAVVNLEDEQEASDNAETNESSEHARTRRDSIDVLIEDFEVETEMAQQSRNMVVDETIEDFLEALESSV